MTIELQFIKVFDLAILQENLGDGHSQSHFIEVVQGTIFME